MTLKLGVYWKEWSLALVDRVTVSVFRRWVAKLEFRAFARAFPRFARGQHEHE